MSGGVAAGRIRFLATLAALGALFTAWVWWGWGGTQATLYVLDLWTLLLAAWATVAAWRRSGRGEADQGPWMLVGVAAGLWTLGQMVWTWIELGQGRAVPTPSLADAGYFGFVVAMLAALGVALESGARGIGRARAFLDAGLLMTAALLVMWPLAFADAFEAGESRLAYTINALYPLGDAVALALAGFMVALQRPGRRAALGWLLASIAFFTAADTGFFGTGASYSTGTLLDAGWFLGLLAIVAAATAPGSLHVDLGAPSLRKGWLAYGPSLVVAATLAAYLASGGGIDRGLAVLALVLLGLTGARGLVGLQENVRLRRRVEDSLAQVHEAQRQRTAMLHSLTHELRNPLVPMRLQLDLLALDDGPGASTRRERLNTVGENVQRLQRLLGDLGELARIEGGRLQLVPAHGDLAPRLLLVARSLQDEATQRGVRLATDVHAPLLAVADGDRVAQVVSNLLSNALKFTPAGGQVTLRAARDGGEVLVEVADTGRGLGAEAVGRLFRPFVQVHEPGSVRERGTGLGLFICRTLAEAQGGRIGVRSPGAGQGATFWMRLPWVDEPPGAPPGVAAVATPA